jgi:hypothetical protein
MSGANLFLSGIPIVAPAKLEKWIKPCTEVVAPGVVNACSEAWRV